MQGYATGLLLARRVLKKLNLDGKYQGKTEVTNFPDVLIKQDQWRRLQRRRTC